MKLSKLFSLLLMISILFLAACEDDKEDAKSDQENFTSAIKQMDQTFVAATMNSSMLLGLMQMPEGLIDIPVEPLLPPVLHMQNLQKGNPQNIYDMQLDSTFINLLQMFEMMYGTHTYNGEEWLHSDQPADEAVIIYPFVNPADESQHSMYLRMYDLNVASTTASIKVQVKVDGSEKFTSTAAVTGTNFLNPDLPTTITSVSMTGIMVDDANKTFNYSMTASQTQIQFSIGPAGGTAVKITAYGTDLLTFESDEEFVTSFSIEYGDIEIEITNIDADENGKLGDVYYKNRDIGDVVLIDEEPYIKFNSGETVPMEELMPNLMAMTMDLP